MLIARRGRAGAELRRRRRRRPTPAPAPTGPAASWLVVEADESDGTHLELPLHGTILTNVELDFLEHYGTFDALVDGFDRYLAQIAGPKVLCADDPVCAELAAAPRRRSRTASPTAPTSAAVDVRSGRRLVLVRRRARRASVSARSPCRCAASTTSSTPPARSRWPMRSACRSTRAAPGARPLRRRRPPVRHPRRRRRRHVRRRLRPPADARSPPSSPRPATAATGGGGSSSPSSPTASTASPRCGGSTPTRSSAPTWSVLTEIYPSGTTPIPGVTGRLIVNAVLDAHPTARVVWLPRRDDLVSFLAGEVGPGDVCISMGCGDIATLPEEILARRASSGGRRERARLGLQPDRPSGTDRLQTAAVQRRPRCSGRSRPRRAAGADDDVPGRGRGGAVRARPRRSTTCWRSPRPGARRDCRCSSSAAAPTCSSPTPGSPASP